MNILNAIAGGIFGWFAVVLFIGRAIHEMNPSDEMPTCWCKGKR